MTEVDRLSVNMGMTVVRNLHMLVPQQRALNHLNLPPDIRSPSLFVFFLRVVSSVSPHDD